MMLLPKFSIITVTYNAEKTIESTIKSIVSQTYPNIEYLIFDGKSKDRTVEIIKKYADHIAYWQSEPDKGLYDAMNKALCKATGDYVWFINAGDSIFAADTVQRMFDSFKSNPLPDIIYGETALIDSAGKFVGMRRLKTPESLNWKSFRMGMLVCHQAFVAKRNVAGSYDLNYRFSSDYDWCIRCLKASKTIHNSQQTLVNYLEEGMTTQNHKASLKERYRIMVKYYGAIPVALHHIWFAVRFYWAKFVKGRV